MNQLETLVNRRPVLLQNIFGMGGFLKTSNFFEPEC